VIASISLGAPRRFVLQPKRFAHPAGTFGLSLGHGSLLVMGGTCQHTFRHAVPKQQAVTGERLNLTFRHLLR
jgi:alkylated DNA repair dioxygenase AlkB